MLVQMVPLCSALNVSLGASHSTYCYYAFILRLDACNQDISVPEASSQVHTKLTDHYAKICSRAMSLPAKLPR